MISTRAFRNLSELEWPSLEVRRDRPSLILFHKVHCVSIEKDKYLTPALSSKRLPGLHIVFNAVDTRLLVML